MTDSVQSPGRLLTRLEATRYAYGSDSSKRKAELLRQFRRARLNTSDQVLRFHEHVTFLRAYPDNQEVLEIAETLLAGFSDRFDLRSGRERLGDSGVAGTDIHYRFFWPTARWLTARWPSQLVIDWDYVEDLEALAAALPLLVSPVEANWLRVLKPSPSESLARLAGTGTDAAYFVRAVESMPGDDFTRERFYDSIGLPLILKAGNETPSRTRAYTPPPRIYFRTEPPQDARPDLWMEISRPPQSIRSVPRKEGAVLIDLAREAMVTRGRDLDTFAYGDPGDVRLIEDGEGLAWAMIGLVPDRRPILRTAYGFLTLRNGVPIGYVQSDALWRCVDLAFNTFSTFRGRGGAHVLGRTMAMLRQIFDATSFTLEPYQLGEGNEEGIESGAWWFYYKAGFRPRNRAIRALAKSELERMRRRPGHRSSPATLANLAKDYLYLDRPSDRAPYWPRLAGVGAEVARNRHGDGDSKDGRRSSLPVGTIRSSDTTKRKVWNSWAPIVELLPGFEDWSSDERRELVAVILAKAGRRDTDYLRLFNRHPRLGKALYQLIGR
ncbi:MAG TPA: hypothetical protein VJ815_09505 [Acidimicrobiia bacterium]|nr:hypothetical protein [Acidimicrobiia bacterium]